MVAPFDLLRNGAVLQVLVFWCVGGDGLVVFVGVRQPIRLRHAVFRLRPVTRGPAIRWPFRVLFCILVWRLRTGPVTGAPLNSGVGRLKSLTSTFYHNEGYAVAMNNEVTFCCDRCKHRVKLPANASFKDRKCRKCGARYQRDEAADFNHQETNVGYKSKSKIIILFCIFIVISVLLVQRGYRSQLHSQQSITSYTLGEIQPKQSPETQQSSTTSPIDKPSDIEDFLEAAKSGDLLTIKRLITELPDINVKSNEGSTALLLASENGHKDVVQILLAKGAYINAERDTDNRTALILASERGFVDIVKVLLDNGADVNAKYNISLTALLNASFRGDINIVMLLLNKGADVNVHEYFTGDTPLMYATEKGYKDVVKALLDNGADINAKRKDGATALMLTTQNQIKELLIKAGEKYSQKHIKELTSTTDNTFSSSKTQRKENPHEELCILRDTDNHNLYFGHNYWLESIKPSKTISEINEAAEFWFGCAQEDINSDHINSAIMRLDEILEVLNNRRGDPVLIASVEKLKMELTK